MSLNWLFEIGTIGSPTYRVALMDETYGGSLYAGLVESSSFPGVGLNRIKVELGTVSYSDFSFRITDDDDAYSVSNVEGKDLIVRFVEDGVQVRALRFKATTANKVYKTIFINCVDYLSTLLDGVFPNKGLIGDLFPEALLSGSGRYSSVDESACVPVVFGSDSYIPLQSIAQSGSVYYILGEVNTNSFAVSKIMSPHAIDGQTEYTAGVDVTIAQSTINGLRVFRPEIDGEYEWWKQGSDRVAPLVEYTDTAYSGANNIIDIIKLVVKEFGAVDGDFDATWASAASTATTRGIVFSRGYNHYIDRKALLLNLMTVGDVNIYFGEYISVSVNSKTSQATIDGNNVLKGNLDDKGTFTYSKVKPNRNDSGYIEYSKSNTPQDKTIKIKVTAGLETNNPSGTTLSLVGVRDNVVAQKIGQLYFQKRFNRDGEIGFLGHPDLITLKPGDVVTVNDALYAGSTKCQIDTMFVNRDSTILFTCSTYSVPLKDFEDLSPDSVSDTSDSSSAGITVLSKAVEHTEAWSEEGADNTQTAMDAGVDIQGTTIDEVPIAIEGGFNGGLLNGATITPARILITDPPDSYPQARVVIKAIPLADDFNWMIIGYWTADEVAFAVSNYGDIVCKDICPLGNRRLGDSNLAWDRGYIDNIWYHFLNFVPDKIDDLQIIEDSGPIQDKNGDKIPAGEYGYEGLKASKTHPVMTNIGELPQFFKKKYDIDITIDEINAIVAGDINEIGIVDAAFIEKHCCFNLNNQMQLAYGAIRQLNKEVTEDVMEPLYELIDDLRARIIVLEKYEIDRSK